MTPRCLISAVSLWAGFPGMEIVQEGGFGGRVGNSVLNRLHLRCPGITKCKCRRPLDPCVWAEAWPRVTPDSHEIAEGVIIDEKWTRTDLGFWCNRDVSPGLLRPGGQAWGLLRGS